MGGFEPRRALHTKLGKANVIGNCFDDTRMVLEALFPQA